MSRTRRVIAVIMGGGRGTRLRPLTRDRAKPAVPLAGMYRLVDIPISNCINSGINQIYLLTQFNTASMHRHIREAYKFDSFGGGFVEILAAEQTDAGDNWYQGTADAVRQNLGHLAPEDDDLVLILSGDQLYRMDYGKMVRQHLEREARVTVAATFVPESEASAFGLMKVQEDLTISEFVEKPTDPAVLDSLLAPPEVRPAGRNGNERSCLASMGIYLFNGSTMKEALRGDQKDFGREIIPSLQSGGGLYAYPFDGYWEDIGTVHAFFEANLRITDDVPPFNFFDAANPIFTRTRYLPAAKVNRCDLERAIVAPGSIITAARIDRSVVGIRSHVRDDTILSNVVMMGAQFYESDDARRETRDLGRPEIGVGKKCHIERAILDMNCRIGDDVHLSPGDKPDGTYLDGAVWIRDGVLVVTKNAVVPSGTRI